MLRIQPIKIRENLTEQQIFEIAMKKAKIKKEDIIQWHISKKSIDARNKNDVYYHYAIDIQVKDEKKYPKLALTSTPKCKPQDRINFGYETISTPKTILQTKIPIIIGAGPCGLFAALTFVKNGIMPIIIEQGKTVSQRQQEVEKFLTTGKLNPFCNIQFGEGGAGTFSDGKLNSGIHSPYCQQVLQDFVTFGAPKEILYLAKPHIGTDYLVSVIQNMRLFIEQKGGKFYFDTKAIDFVLGKNQEITTVVCENVITKQTLTFETDTVILAIGHSSHDTLYKLSEKGIQMEPKNFSVGVRIEHQQKEINQAQYGKTTKLQLPPADYKLAYHSPSGRSCYTFCMCPGGTVMASSSDPNTVVTNGMSTYLRNKQNANSAVLVNVTPDDFPSSSPLAGIEFQKQLEQKAFILGGKNYFAPIQRWEDFVANRKTTKIGSIKPSYLPGYTGSNLNEILPDFVACTLKEGIFYFGTKLHGFDHPDSILTGVETRSSSPVKIPRDVNFMANKNGIYPCGEGAGYAGGIMSAAVDGMKCAIHLLTK